MILDEQTLQFLDSRYVTKTECANRVESIGTKLTNDLVRISVIETETKQIKWLLTAVAGGIITMLIKMFFGA